VLRLAAKAVSLWRCGGWKQGGGAFKSWHITSTDIHEASFPGLDSVISRGFAYAVAFHGFEPEEDDPDIIIGGGGTSDSLKHEIKEAIEGAIAGSGITVRIARPDEEFGGDSPRNIVNRLTASEANGVQIEQSLQARSDYGQAIADAVANVYNPKIPQGPDYQRKVLTKHPVAYWWLGEPRGPTAFDAAKHGHDGTYHGTPRYGEVGAIKCDPNTAIKLDGYRSYIEVPSSKDVSQPTSGQGLSVEVWVRPDVLVFEGETEDPYVHWLGKGGTGQYEWALRFYSEESTRPNRISAYIWNPVGGLGAGAYFQDKLEPEEWIHVVACYAPGDKTKPGAGVSIYKNGVLRGEPATQPGARYSAFNIVPAHGAAPLRFGARDLKSFLIGGLDEVAIYPRVLTAAEIMDNYETGIFARCRGGGIWRFLACLWDAVRRRLAKGSHRSLGG